jgi:hypothetical protein
MERGNQRIGGWSQRRGRSIAERPKSREETPKEGSGADRSISTPLPIDMGLFVVRCNGRQGIFPAFRACVADRQPPMRSLLSNKRLGVLREKSRCRVRVEAK